MENKENRKAISKINKIKMQNLNVENLTYLLAVVRDVKISKNSTKIKRLPYKMRDFIDYIERNNLTCKQIFRDFGYFLERSEDDRIKNIVKDLVCEHCSFYNVVTMHPSNLTMQNEYYAQIDLPFPNNIVMHVRETVKDLKAGKKEFPHIKPYTRVPKTFDDGIEIIPEQK